MHKMHIPWTTSRGEVEKMDDAGLERLACPDSPKQGVRMLKNVLSKRWCFDVAVVVLVVLMGTVVMLPVLDSFAMWLNSITDIVLGAIEALIVTSALEVLVGEKRFRTWQYWIPAVVSILAVSCLFIASRSSTASMCIGMAVLALVLTGLYALLRRLIYVPSTWTFEERQQHVWRKIRKKAEKLGREKFLAMEMEFRCYPTIDGTVEGDLDVSRPWATVVHDEYGTVPLTAKMCASRGLDEQYATIRDALVAELDASGIM